MRSTILALLLATLAPAQDEFRVYTEHPRLFLTKQRLRLLKREHERDSMRWRQFDLLVRATAEMREPGFALALHYAVTGDATIGKRAVDWAVGPGTDLRQLALVLDWCQPLLAPSQSKALEAKIRKLAEQKTGSDIPVTRDRVLAWIATADEAHSEESPLRDVVKDWWRGALGPKLADGKTMVAPDQLFALLEILHATRDNLKIDLREEAPDYFRELPTYEVLANYPAPLPAPENEYRIPVYQGTGQPDLDRAALARAAGLSTVAYDNNALESQYLQGWLIQDRFMLQGVFGAPYEFLWANPYQPGLSYFQLPVFFHDPHSGALFLRSNWEDDAVWFGIYQSEAQLFRDGRVTVLNQKGPLPPKAEGIPVGETNVLVGRNPMQFAMEGGRVLVVSLKPHTKYLIETDDEEMSEYESDGAGTLVLEYPGDWAAGVRIQEAMNGSNGTQVGFGSPIGEPRTLAAGGGRAFGRTTNVPAR
ncbi:MAG TPA: hypothetical protein VKT81_18095 [Bryobacteraceae bacterium]|nr:hypothetical protein [Bryobacteraceae bacterium]